LDAETPKDTKLIVVPSQLVKHLRAIAGRQGVSLSNFTTEALKQAVRAEEAGASLEEAVDLYRLHEVQRGAGAIQIPRSNLNAMITELYQNHGDELLEVWKEAGRWYGEYLLARLGGEALGFFEKALMVSWNLDEVEVENDGLMVAFRFTSFAMPLGLTELLISYISGAMSALGYVVMEKDYLKGLASIYYRKLPNR
jgi:hypothetical protein